MEYLALISLAAMIFFGFAHLYPELAKSLIGQVPHLLKKWADWMEKKLTISIGSYSTSISMIELVVFSHTLAMLALCFLSIILFALFIVSGIGKPIDYTILRCGACILFAALTWKYKNLNI